MLKLILTANNFAEMRNRLQDAIAQLSMLPADKLTGGETSGIAAVVERIAENNTAALPPIEAAPAPKKTRRKKTEAVETPAAAILPTTESAAPAASTTPQVPTESTGEKLTPTFSKSAATEALTRVYEKHGMIGARDMLQRFGVGKIGELDPSKYGPFVEDCQKALD